MKTFCIIISLTCFLKAKSQEILWHDNRKNSVTAYFNDKEVISSLARENNSKGFACVRFIVDKKGKIIHIKNVFADDSLLYIGIRDRLIGSTGKWIIKKGRTQQKFQITLFIANETVNAVIKKIVKEPVFYDSYKRLAINEQTNVEDVTLIPLIYIKYLNPKQKPLEIMH